MSETEFPKLSRPPLKEVLVDIRLREDLPVSILGKIKAPKGFTVAKQMKQSQFQVKVEMEKPSLAEVLTDDLFGWRYETEDMSAVVQLRRNGMTYSIVKDYPGWHMLREVARGVWQEFLAVSGPVNVSRIATRYINAISIPLGADCDDYLTTAPRVPKSVPQIITSFIQRVLIPFENEQAIAIFTQTLESPVTAAVLDIDVFSQCSLGGESADIWSRLESLRSIADRVFFSSLTEKVIDSYR